MTLYLRHFLWSIVVLFCLSFAVKAEESNCLENDLTPYCSLLRDEVLYKHADAEMNAIYKRIMALLSAANSEHIDYLQLKPDFVKAQKAWLRFLVAECDAWYLLNQAGAQRNENRMQCLTQRTAQRTEQLKQWLVELQADSDQRQF